MMIIWSVYGREGRKKSHEIYSNHVSSMDGVEKGEKIVKEEEEDEEEDDELGVKDIRNINNKLEILCAINISQPFL